MKWILKGRDGFYLRRIGPYSSSTTDDKKQAMPLTGTRDYAEGFRQALIIMGAGNYSPEILEDGINSDKQGHSIR